MLTVRLNKKALLNDIITTTTGGMTQTFIVKPDSNKSMDRIVHFAYSILQQGSLAFIETQFQSQFTPRPKRLEVVELRETEILIYKFSNSSRYDKDALELYHTIKEIQNLYTNLNFHFSGILLVDSTVDVNFINTSLSDIGLNITAKQF